jgi:predicted nucleotidyltransferase
MKKPLIIAFGSQVTGRATQMSDFDFGVFGEKALSLSERTDIAGFLAERFKINEDKIDLVDLRTASPILKFQVARTGRLIEGENFDFIRFKVRAFKEYQDTAKFRRVREQVMLQNHVS